MERGSKYNTYQCPECTYAATRKYNLSVHMLKSHNLTLSPYLYRSQKEWVFAQRWALQRDYFEAETEREKNEAYKRLYNFLILWGDKGYWSIINAIPEAWVARRKHEEMAAQIKDI